MENPRDLSRSFGVAGQGGYLSVGGHPALGDGPDALNGSGCKGVSGHGRRVGARKGVRWSGTISRGWIQGWQEIRPVRC
jgi:hypothetical protein